MNLAEALPTEIKRVEAIMEEYKKLEMNVGMFTYVLMRMDVDEARKACKEGDVVRMLASYNSLKEYDDL